MFIKRGPGQNLNHSASAAAAAAAAAAAVCAVGPDGSGLIPCGGGHGKGCEAGKGGCHLGREVARFQLQIAPRHVIPPQCKEDILRRAFRGADEHSGIQVGGKCLPEEKRF
jgi:hypothetical protein